MLIRTFVQSDWAMAPAQSMVTRTMAKPIDIAVRAIESLHLGIGNASGIWRSPVLLLSLISLMGWGEVGTAFIGIWCKQMRSRLSGWTTLPNFKRVFIRSTARTLRWLDPETLEICYEASMGSSEGRLCGWTTSTLWRVFCYQLALDVLQAVQSSRFFCFSGPAPSRKHQNITCFWLQLFLYRGWCC